MNSKLGIIKGEMMEYVENVNNQNQQLLHQIERLRTLNHKWFELYSQQIKTTMLLRTRISHLEVLKRSMIDLQSDFDKLKKKYVKKCYLLNEMKKEMNEKIQE